MLLSQAGRKIMLASDFEGIMMFFRVDLPRMFPDEASSTKLIKASMAMKVPEKKLQKLVNVVLKLSPVLCLEQGAVEPTSLTLRRGEQPHSVGPPSGPTDYEYLGATRVQTRVAQRV
jgi:hypothetical protein